MWISAIAALSTIQAPGPAVSDLRWLAGDWACVTGDWRRGTHMVLEEMWVAGAAVRLVGVGRATRGDATISLEHMRIDADAVGRLTFYGSPMGRPPVPFRLVRAGATELVFENPAHDAPQRISYRRDGESLVGETSQLDGSRRETWRFTRHRSGRAPQPCRAESS